MSIINTSRAARYQWQGTCDGWPLVAQPGLSVTQERMPPGTSEERHFHARARQFFYVLSGVLCMEVDGAVFHLSAQDGMEIAPNTPHQARNDSESDVEFLVISAPGTQGDRVAADAMPEG
ncbi:Cupin domain protein [Roseovarius gaetbuli]|uniref:Cupin domain protein n=1 Tax=Roseovarius gaetbuli TaxID=1356575 RepID=A0A1X6Y313_9RHOB|nr:cupin domain-containing protein [Roseovarius gaetbuli]SLN09538.1 Cupin domain protein [Roseovarius gaetbuli]